MKWAEKPYHSLDYEMKRRFGEKVYRLALNGGMTCPNRDGTLGYGGCIFCSSGGSGEFAADAALSVTGQILQQKKQILAKRPVHKFIAYFQAYTNTYAPVEYLERIFLEAIRDEDIVALSVATRPDCLPDDVLDLLERLNRRKPVWIELGLQTVHDSTAALIRRGYGLSTFEDAVRKLRARGLEVIVHVILGLPGETSGQMLETVNYLNTCDIQGIKLQLLHILKGTDLETYYHETPFPIMTMEEYIELLIDCIEHLSPDIVIHRLTGDGPAGLLIAPQWSRSKRTVLNRFHAAMRSRNTWQGKAFTGQQENSGGALCRNHLHYIN
ncbi:MAG TPA: TIGR01212 family radical SAM protein [Candidatus Choladousia intestinipullorum]|nr:TIGR01212 family radical SAM protein [Candidatus Choladousia intestinipullorum]